VAESASARATCTPSSGTSVRAASRWGLDPVGLVLAREDGGAEQGRERVVGVPVGPVGQFTDCAVIERARRESRRNAIGDDVDEFVIAVGRDGDRLAPVIVGFGPSDRDGGAVRDRCQQFADAIDPERLGPRRGGRSRRRHADPDGTACR